MVNLRKPSSPLLNPTVQIPTANSILLQLFKVVSALSTLQFTLLCLFFKKMAKRLIPLFNRVLIEKIIPPSKTNSGILLPEKTVKLNSGKVVAVGPGLRDKEGSFIPVSVKEGDTVLLPEYGGKEVKLGDKEFHLYDDHDILGTLHD